MSSPSPTTRPSQPGSPIASWRICLLGGLRAEATDRIVAHFRTHKTATLLAYLACHPDRAHPREMLVDLLWPDADLEAGRQNLRRALTDLRQALEPWVSRSATGGDSARPDSGAEALPAPQSPALVTVIVADRSIVRLNPAAVATDVAEFEAALDTAERSANAQERAQWLARAVSLYQGEFLPGFYEEWVVREQSRLEERYLRALGQWVEALEALAEWEPMAQAARKWIDADPEAEDAHRALMRALAALGEPQAALRHFREMQREECEDWPGPETEALAEQIRQQQKPEISAPNLATPDRLPHPLTRLIGREQDSQEVQTALASARLVTLTGAGGVGKTRLAIQVAHTLTSGYAHGAWFVELAALSDPALVPQAVIATLGLYEAPGQPPLQTLTWALKARHLLLVLDNCEHLLDACARLVEALLHVCPRTQVLATSRESLGLAGETIYRVPSLSVPGEPLGSEIERERLLLESAAARLFIERVKAVLPGFELQGGAAEAVAQVCRRLDGIPLALELAAGRVKALSVGEMARRLEEGFGLLTGGSRTALARHQTLRATLDWSYHLLSAEEQALLQGLSVFAGGWTLEAAEAVGAATPHPNPEFSAFDLPNPADPGFPPQIAFDIQGRSGVGGSKAAGFGNPGLGRPEGEGTDPLSLWEKGRGEGLVLDLLTSLVDKSLVVYEAEGEGRYRLLETVRQYAAERLVESGEEQAVRGRHLDYFLRLAEEADARWLGPEWPAWQDRLEADLDNLRAALDWCTSPRLAPLGSPFHSCRLSPISKAENSGAGGEVGLRLTGALGGFMQSQGYGRWSSLHGRLSRLLDREDTQEPTLARARALWAAGYALHWTDGEQRTRVEEALEIARRLDDKPTLVRALLTLAHSGRYYFEPQQAEALSEEGLAIARELRDPGGIAWGLQNLGSVAFWGRGDAVRGQALCEEGLRMARTAGSEHLTASVMNCLGEMYLNQGDFAAARSLTEESILRFTKLRAPTGVGAGLTLLVNAALRQKDYAAAARFAEQRLDLFQRQGHITGMASTHRELGDVACRQHDAVSAILHYEQALAIDRDLGSKRFMAWAYWGLARAARLQGELAAMRSHREEALRLLRELGSYTDESTLVPAWDLGALAHQVFDDGDYELARALYRESLILYQEAGDRFGVARTLETHAGLAGREGQPGRAARLLSAAEAHAKALGRALPVWRAEERRHMMDDAQAALGEEAFAAAWAEGRAMTLEQAVAVALAEAD